MHSSVMALSPTKYLISPNILKKQDYDGHLLTAHRGMWSGSAVGYLVGVQLLGVGQGVYFGEMRAVLAMHDISIGFWKSLSFGLIISWVAATKDFIPGLEPKGSVRLRLRPW